MRYLIFGDVHGNLPALERMLEVEKGNFDQLICHGDVVNYGPWGNECVALLKNLKATTLKGNHEEFSLKGYYPGQNLIAKTFFDFCYPKFNEIEIIASYGDFKDVAGYRIVHSIADRYFFPDTDYSSITFDRNFILGHSHYQFFKKVKEHNLYNTGSVGQNRQFINQICYLTLNDEDKIVTLKSLKYNVDLLINQMKIENYPDICLAYYNQKNRI